LSQIVCTLASVADYYDSETLFFLPELWSPLYKIDLENKSRPLSRRYAGYSQVELSHIQAE